MKSEAGMTGQELVSPRCVKLASSLLTILSQDRIPIDPSAALAGIGCGDEPDRAQLRDASCDFGDAHAPSLF